MIPKETIFLIVDDTDAMRNITTSLLRGMGLENVITACNGQDALQIIQRQRIDIVLSDWNMPVMTGLDLLKNVRRSTRTASLPFVMITAEADRDRVGKAISAGVSDLLIKPYTSAQLAERVERSLTNQRGERSSKERIAVPATVLAVDDTPDNLKLLYELLKDEFTVRTASNGQKAIDICQSESPPGLVLLDVMMPGMDGFEVAHRLRQHPNTETIPVIFVTAKNDQESRLKALGLGAVDFVSKPIDPEELLPRVRNFMRYVSMHKELQDSYDAMMDSARLREDVEHITRHDLRGPLANIVSLSQLLAGASSFGTNEKAQVALITESALEVLDMINLSSEIFKIEMGRFELNAKEVNLSELVERVVQSVRVTYASKGIEFIVENEDDFFDDGFTEKTLAGPLMALGDAAFCHSILQNLMKNACEAAPNNTRIKVVFSRGDYADVVIGNTGVVPAVIREKFFDKFSSYGKEGGSGLGTYSAKLLTEAQGGKITMNTSEEHNRTKITVQLPLLKD